MAPGSGLNSLFNSNGNPARATGIVYLLISALCFSFAGVFTKGVAAGSWEVIFWRAAFGLLFAIALYGMKGKITREVTMKPSGIMISLVAVISTIAFLSSFKHTSISNVVMIYASTPMLAGVMGWWLMREKMSFKEFAASMAVLFGVGIVVYGSLGKIEIFGDALAVLMAITYALIIVLFRKYPETPSGGVNIFSCLALLPICFLFGEPFSTSFHDIMLLAVFAIVFLIASISLQEGSKLLSPTLSALLSIAETPLAPIWAWFFFAEIPVLSTLIGGVVIVLAITLATVRYSSASEPA